MPVRNERDYIRRSLAAVLRQDYPRESMEIIVADGMSTDETRAIVLEMSAEFPIIKLIDNPRGTAASGLNLATAAARGEIIVRVDGHCEIAPDYVRNCVSHLVHDGVEGVGGAVETVGETDVACTIAAAMSSSFGVGGTAFRTGEKRTVLVDTIPFPAYTRKIVDAMGPYDETLVRDQDDEYNYRIRKAGGKLLLASDVHSTYYSRASLSSLSRQYFEYGYWKARVLWKHPRQMKARQFVPGAFVAFLGVGLLLSPFSSRARRLTAATLALYGSACMVNSWNISRRDGWQHLFRLPRAFTALHLGYGSGFLLGNAALIRDRMRHEHPEDPPTRANEQ
jgi:glycosyltransferase involved in cell wall biosynthesis